MEKMVYTEKMCGATCGNSTPAFNFPLQKPMLCPHCGAYEDGTITDRKLLPIADSNYYGVVLYTCTCCKKRYIVIYDIDTSKKSAKFGAFFPTPTVSYQNDLLAELSPKFIVMYHQALRAEQMGDIELAAIGFRQALECLVKDYAITELGKPQKEVIDKKLYEAIGDYLNSTLASAADVVRILGNDYAHYERKYPQHDFELLKSYMEIFIKLVETNVMIAHPPVSRPSK